MQDFIKPYKRYAQFDGRSDRKEFWYFVLFYVIVSAVLAMIDGMVFGHTVVAQNGDFSIYRNFSPLSGIFFLGSLIPYLALAVRRLHDTSRSGWWILLWFIPLIGWIVLLVFYCERGKPEANKFGEPPAGSQPQA